MSTRILVTGANGQLGQSIKKISHEYNDFEFVFVTRKQLDLNLPKNIKTYFEGKDFAAIINCAAFTAVDKAESETELAEQINHYAVRQLAQIASENDTLLIHISTDYVFNGQSTSPYNEADLVDPKSVYGSSKLNGENSMQATDVNGYIIRTSWVYSEFGNNFVKTMLKLGKDRDHLGVVYEQIGSPTYATDLARAILSILNKNQSIAHKGIKYLHYSNEGVCSWFDFAKHIFELSQTTCNVEAIRTRDYPTPAARPDNTVMDKTKIKKEYNMTIPYWVDSLKECLSAMSLLKQQ